MVLVIKFMQNFCLTPKSFLPLSASLAQKTTAGYLTKVQQAKGKIKSCFMTITLPLMPGAILKTLKFSSARLKLSKTCWQMSALTRRKTRNLDFMLILGELFSALRPIDS